MGCIVNRAVSAPLPVWEIDSIRVWLVYIIINEKGVILANAFAVTIVGTDTRELFRERTIKRGDSRILNNFLW